MQCDEARCQENWNRIRRRKWPFLGYVVAAPGGLFLGYVRLAAAVGANVGMATLYGPPRGKFYPTIFALGMAVNKSASEKGPSLRAKLLVLALVRLTQASRESAFREGNYEGRSVAAWLLWSLCVNANVSSKIIEAVSRAATGRCGVLVLNNCSRRGPVYEMSKRILLLFLKNASMVRIISCSSHLLVLQTICRCYC